MWTLGPFQLDPVSFALHRDGQPVALQRRPLDLLLYLVARPGQIVSREELQSEVWSGVVVSAGALSTAVYEARAALGDLDRSGADRWIETVRGRGIRFSGPVAKLAQTSSADDSPPFVGRSRLLGELSEAVQQLAVGRGGTRLIEGLAGMGKTRLVQEATRDAEAAQVCTVYCERGGPPYWPWMQAVRALSRSHRRTGSMEPGWLTALPADDIDAHFQFERADRMLQVLATVAERRPVVLVIEDIHWADTPSLALLESLTHRLADLPVLILATRRVGEDTGDAIAAWTRSPDLRRYHLDPLSLLELYALVGAIVGRSPSPEVVGWIQTHSGGVPLMVRELAEHVHADHTSLPDVPQLAQQVLARRFEGLGGETRVALAVAALCGERFDLPLVEAAAEGLLEGDRAWVRDGLESGILVSDVHHPLRFAFRHSLLRDAARGELSAEQTAKWHGRLARVLEQQHPDPHGADVSQIARHAAAATLVEDDLERPLRYALLAARKASEVFAWEEVRVHSEHALGWVHFMPPGSERDAQETDAALLRCAGVTPSSGHVEETAALLARIEPILGRSRDPRSRALAEGFRFANARSLGDFSLARTCADRVAEIEGMAPVAACWRLGMDSLSGELSAATAPLADEDSLGDDPRFLEYARLCGRDPEVDRLGLTAFASFFLGHDVEALERAERAVRWADDRGDARSGIWAIFITCMLHELRRDWVGLAALAPEVDRLASRHHITPWLGAGIGLAWWARENRKASADGKGAFFASIMRDRGHSPNVSLRTMLLMLSSRIFMHSGELADAETVARDGLRYCEQTDERFMEPELERQLARILETRGSPGDAREARARALEGARTQGNVVTELRTLADASATAGVEPRDRARIGALRQRLGARLGPHERGILDRLLVGAANQSRRLDA